MYALHPHWHSSGDRCIHRDCLVMTHEQERESAVEKESMDKSGWQERELCAWERVLCMHLHQTVLVRQCLHTDVIINNMASSGLCVSTCSIFSLSLLHAFVMTSTCSLPLSVFCICISHTVHLSVYAGVDEWMLWVGCAQMSSTAISLFFSALMCSVCREQTAFTVTDTYPCLSRWPSDAHKEREWATWACTVWLCLHHCRLSLFSLVSVFLSSIHLPHTLIYLALMTLPHASSFERQTDDEIDALCMLSLTLLFLHAFLKAI